MNSLQRNCLVAGSTGLIGNLLIEQLVKSDNKVTALSRYELSSSNNLLTFKKIDFENEESFKEIFTREHYHQSCRRGRERSRHRGGARDDLFRSQLYNAGLWHRDRRAPSLAVG